MTIAIGLALGVQAAENRDRLVAVRARPVLGTRPPDLLLAALSFLERWLERESGRAGASHAEVRQRRGQKEAAEDDGESGEPAERERQSAEHRSDQVSELVGNSTNRSHLAGQIP